MKNSTKWRIANATGAFVVTAPAVALVAVVGAPAWACLMFGLVVFNWIERKIEG